MQVTVTVTTQTGFSLPPDQPESDVQAFVTEAKAHGVRPVFSVGGWSGSIYFSDLVATAAERITFARQLKAFMDKYGFVGVDLGQSPSSTERQINADAMVRYSPGLTELETLQIGNIPTEKALVRCGSSLEDVFSLLLYH